MTALLQVFFEDEEKVVKYVGIAKDMGYEILPPDINKSDVGFTIAGDNAIRFGLGSIKGLGSVTLNHIINERQERRAYELLSDETSIVVETQEEVNRILESDLEGEVKTTKEVREITVGGPYTSIEDLIERIPKRNLNKKSIKSLCFSGSLDLFMPEETPNRYAFLNDIFTARGVEMDEEDMEKLHSYQEKFKYEKEKEVLGTYVSGHVLDRVAVPTDWDLLDEALHSTSVVLQNAHIIRTKKGDQMAFLTVDTLEGEQKLILFPKQFDTVKEALVPGMILQVSIRMQMNWQRNSKDFIIHTVRAPKRINKHLWKEIEQKNTGVTQ